MSAISCFLGLRPGLAFESEDGAQAPVRLEIIGNLPIDRTDRGLHRLVGDLAVGVVDD
jgi:hypothetical protein